MALNLKTKVRVVVKEEDKTTLDCTVSSQRLTKKERSRIGKVITSAQAVISEDTMAGVDGLEKAAKLRFGMQISGDDKEKLAEFAEEYGYAVLMDEIDVLVKESQGK